MNVLSALLAAALGLAAASAAPATNVTLLPLGDSITYGCGSESTPPDWWAVCCPQCGGYRAPLYESIVNASLPVTFVGSLANGPPSIPPLQQRHEGHPGWRIGQLAARVAVWAAYKPDVILIHLGTNDIGQNHTTAELVADMGSLLALINTTLPTARVFVATILNMVNPLHPQWGPAVAAYNSALPSVVAAAAKGGLAVSLVDLNRATGMCSSDVNATDCCQGNGPSSSHPDKVHPTGAGYVRMAAAWWTAIEPALREAAASKTAVAVAGKGK